MTRTTDIHPTELTIALGCTAPTEDNGRLAARLEATYRLGPGETDLALIASVKGAEVSHALAAAWQQARQVSATPEEWEPFGPEPPETEASDYETACDPPFLNDDEWDDTPEADDPDGKGPCPPAVVPPPVLPTAGPSRHPLPNPATTTGTEPSTQPREVEPPIVETMITKPQKLAILSLARRVGLEGYKLTDVLRSQFGTWSLDRLTKAQAHDLHVALQRSLQEKQEKEVQAQQHDRQMQDKERMQENGQRTDSGPGTGSGLSSPPATGPHPVGYGRPLSRAGGTARQY